VVNRRLDHLQQGLRPDAEHNHGNREHAQDEELSPIHVRQVSDLRVGDGTEYDSLDQPQRFFRLRAP
jgi:hypothetical protein